MAVVPKKLDLKLGDLVEVAGQRYDVVSNKNGGITLEPAITQTVAEIHAEHGGRPLSDEELGGTLGDLRTDGEG